MYHSGLPFLEYPIPPIGSTYKYGQYSPEEFSFYKQMLLLEEQKVKDIYEKISKRPIKTNFILSPNSTFLNIINTIKEAEYPRNNLPSNVFFTGPSFQGHEQQSEQPFITKGNKKLIYISLGTVFNKQPDLFIKIIKAIESLDIELLVAAGASYAKLKSTSFKPNVRIEKFVPQQEVLKQTDIFITHGGKNSINESLKYGVPMILFPVGGEQEYNANLVEFLNAGKNLGEIKGSFTAEEMKQTIKSLFNNKQIIKSVEQLKYKHSGSDGASLAYQLIFDKLIQSS